MGSELKSAFSGQRGSRAREGVQCNSEPCVPTGELPELSVLRIWGKHRVNASGTHRGCAGHPPRGHTTRMRHRIQHKPLKIPRLHDERRKVGHTLDVDAHAKTSFRSPRCGSSRKHGHLLERNRIVYARDPSDGQYMRRTRSSGHNKHRRRTTAGAKSQQWDLHDYRDILRSMTHLRSASRLGRDKATRSGTDARLRECAEAAPTARERIRWRQERHKQRRSFQKESETSYFTHTSRRATGREVGAKQLWPEGRAHQGWCSSECRPVSRRQTQRSGIAPRRPTSRCFSRSAPLQTTFWTP